MGRPSTITRKFDICDRQLSVPGNTISPLLSYLIVNKRRCFGIWRAIFLSNRREMHRDCFCFVVRRGHPGGVYVCQLRSV